jgi:hypothetical protein
MTRYAGQRGLSYDRYGAVNEEVAAERYRLKQRRARSGKAGEDDRARPLEFDESGFPVAQRNSSLVQRVARLLNPT